MQHQIFSILQTAVLENTISVSVACCHSKGRVALVGGIGGEVLTKRYGLLQLGGDSWRRWACQSVTWKERKQKATNFYQWVFKWARIWKSLFVIDNLFRLLSVSLFKWIHPTWPSKTTQCRFWFWPLGGRITPQQAGRHKQPIVFSWLLKTFDYDWMEVVD